MKRRQSHDTMSLLAGLTLGVALMYFLDPSGGARRRALIRDRAGKLVRRGKRKFRRRIGDLERRAQGLGARAAGLGRDEEVSDQVLVERVRARLGHHTPHANRIEVLANDGIVTLRGAVEPFRVEEVLEAVRQVQGVEHVRNELESDAGQESA